MPITYRKKNSIKQSYLEIKAVLPIPKETSMKQHSPASLREFEIYIVTKSHSQILLPFYHDVMIISRYIFCKRLNEKIKNNI